MGGTIWRWVALCVVVVVAAGCAGRPKVALDAQKRQAIRHVALVEVPEPERYHMDPGQLPGGAGLYMYGAIGGLILGTIEATRFENATKQFMTSLSANSPALSQRLLLQIEAGLRTGGYEVTRIPPLPTLDGREPDLSKVNGPFDAVLVTELSAGYAAEAAGGRVEPRVRLVASLHQRSTRERIFADDYVYSSKKFGEQVQLAPDVRFSFPTMEAAYAGPDTTVDGMREGTVRLATRLLMDLAPASATEVAALVVPPSLPPPVTSVAALSPVPAADSPRAVPAALDAMRRPGDWFEYRFTDDITHLSRNFSLTVDRVTAGLVTFNGGARIEGPTGELVESGGSLLGELDALQPPGGWAAFVNAGTGTRPLQFSAKLPGGGPVKFDLTATVSATEPLHVGPKPYAALRIHISGWSERQSTISGANHTVNSGYQATVWYSPELQRVLRFSMTRRSPVSSESLELVGLGSR